MTRDQMIEWLVDNDLDYVNGSNGGLEWLRYALQTGIVGYENQTDQELKNEMIERDPDFYNLFNEENHA